MPMPPAISFVDSSGLASLGRGPRAHFPCYHLVYGGRLRSRPPAVTVFDTVALLGRAQQGDPEARHELFARYLPRIRVIVAMRLGRPIGVVSDIDDVVQQCMLRVLQGLSEFTPRSEASFFHWVSRLVANELADLLRRADAAKRGSRRVVQFGAYDTSLLADVMGPARGPSPSEAAGAIEVGGQIESAMLELAERDREAIVLRELCGMSYAEIAEELGLGKESSARAVVARAKARLAERLP